MFIVTEYAALTDLVEIIILARNVKSDETAPKVKLTFHPKHSFWRATYLSQKSLDCLNLNFISRFILFSREKNNRNMIFILGHFDQNGHHAHIW